MKGDITRDIMFAYHNEIAEASLAIEAAVRPTASPNWKSQKTARKIRRRLSNAPKAVRRRCGWKEGRHG